MRDEGDYMNFPTQIGTDKEGYIINYTSKDNISLNYLSILEELIKLLKQDLNDKLHSIYGENLSINFPKMKPDIKICQSLNQDVISSLINYKNNIIKNEADSNILISALRRIIRGAYCLVSVIDKSWITKIDDMIIVLNYYFPSETSFKEMDLMLKNKEEITSKQVLKLIDYFVPWFNKHRI